MNAIKQVFVAATIAGALLLATPASAWTNYTSNPSGPVTFRQPFLGGPYQDFSGWNYWTNNRVWRNPGHPFYLGHNNSSGYYFSNTNWNTNPFYFTPSGYSQLTCVWEYWNDISNELYPVTCQANS
jgi:hypothetical protein